MSEKQHKRYRQAVRQRMKSAPVASIEDYLGSRTKMGKTQLRQPRAFYRASHSRKSGTER